MLASVSAAVGLIAADRALTWGSKTRGRSVLDHSGPEAHDDRVCRRPRGRQRRHVVVPACAARHASARATAPGEPGYRWRHAALRPGLDGRDDRASRADRIGIPIAMETASQVMRKLNIRAEFPSREYLAARIDLDRPFEEEATPAFEARRAQTFAALERRIAQEPGVVAVTFADRAPGSLLAVRRADVEISAGAGSTFEYGLGQRRWARSSSRHSTAQSSSGGGSTRATGVPRRER